MLSAFMDPSGKSSGVGIGTNVRRKGHDRA
jgi:hypothetical protein